MLKYLFLITFSTITIFSQLKEGDHLLGPSLGFWAKPNAPTLGLNYEYQISQLGEAGTISIGGVFRYTSYNYYYPHDDYYDYNYTTLGFQSNLNFNRIGDGKFVPFVGLVLGYNYINSTYHNKSGTFYDASYSSGAWLWAQLGMRYFFSQKVAGAVRLGLGNFNFNVIEIGVDFKL
jgi:hypothetical protein